MSEMRYITPDEKLASIVAMSDETYGILLDAPRLEDDVLEGIKSADFYNKCQNNKDKRFNAEANASRVVKFSVTDKEERDCLLKTLYLQITFADEDMFNDMVAFGDTDEDIARHFSTDENNVRCKKALNAKLAQLEKPKTITK